MKPARRDDDLAGLDDDLAEPVRASTRTPFTAAIVGFLGVALAIGIDLLYGGRPSAVAYAAIALAFAVVEATVLGGALRDRLAKLRWARVEQLQRNEERITIAASRSTRARQIVTAEIEENDE